MNVPPEEIVGLSKVFLRHAGVKVKSPVTDGEQDKVMLVLMYGGTVQGGRIGEGANSEEIVTPDVIRLFFSNGKYYMYEKAESQGDYSAKWNMSTKMAGKKERSAGFFEGKMNPYLIDREILNYP